MKIANPILAHHPDKYMYEPQPYILLIDDDEEDLEMFATALKDKGIKVQMFASPIKALHYLSLMSGNMDLPSLVIMDYNMPKRNGYEMLMSIKGNSDTKGIPVVIYSTSISDFLRKQLSEAGALNCYDKPWNGRELDRHFETFKELFFQLVTNKQIA